jgi:hypothetical protein
MADKKQKEEKFYTPEEVAVAVLKKTHELLKASSLFKANSSHEIENGGEPSNDEAEAPAYLAEADIENSGAHGEKGKKKASKPGIEGADKDGDGDIDGDDAIEAQEESSGQDLDGDGEAGEAPEHKAKIAAAAKPAPKADEAKDPKDAVKAATEEKSDDKAKDKKPPFAKSEEDTSITRKEKEPSLKKFMLARKMKKAGVPTSDARQAEQAAGAAPAPTPAEKIKEQPKLEMEKNKSVEKLMGIEPKAGA